MKIISVVGDRPNFMKNAAFCRTIESHKETSDYKVEHLLVHPGQHYENLMSRAFIDEPEVPQATILITAVAAIPVR